MKSLAAVAVLVLAAPVFAAPAPKPVKKGDSYDLPQRNHKASVPRAEVAVAKVAAVTDAMVAKVAKARHGEVEYCWERLPSSQRVKSTVVLHFAIEPSGEVAAIDVGGDAPAEAASCIAELAHRWTFPAVAAKTSIAYPIRLR
jgi:hypothetical protein